MNDIERHDERDDRLDRNLLAAAHHLELPVEPSPLQRARWKRAPEKGILGMKREKFWKVLGAGGAMAACVTLAVILGLGGTKSVNAAAIFDSLRDAIRKSLWIEIDNLQAEGVTANGRVLLVFTDRDENSAPTDANDALAASFVELRMTAAPDQEDFPGLDLETAVGVTPDDSWCYLKTHYIPATIYADAPFLAFFAPMLNNGVVLDIDALDTAGNGNVAIGAGAGHGPVAKITFSTTTSNPSGDGANDPDDGEDDDGFEFSFSTTNSADAGEGTVDHVNEHLHEMMFGSDFRATANTPEAQAAIESHMELVRDFLTGRFTPEQMTRFIDMIESSASEVNVAPIGDGAFLLRASGFEFHGAISADEDMALEVQYHEGGRIDNVKLLNLGDGAGELRFIFSDDDATSEVFDRSRYESRDGVRTINNIGELFSGFGQ